MTRVFDENGNVVPVTVVQATPNVVTQIKTAEKDGYNAIQLGLGEAKKQKKPQAGHLKPSKSNSRYLREVTEISIEVEEGAEPKEVKVGDKISVDIFKPGDKIVVQGISKGKGFAGVIKRHGFKRGPMSHGSHHYREPGSIGSMFPQHVFKGTKLPGRMGSNQVTVKNLKIVSVDKENNLLAVRGAVPGPAKGVIVIRG
ncbi:MAG: 50S ribosomal protein L3 [candidate division CPR2 bacterium GW2011_GWC1_41_48]|uniref:50S ribosomal protein L3 n=1 Tax=candidate division CPR2 bacterium GW2011_GWC1_41_48 TaxID=1618344 RepID=A0A0G0W9V8_UNCC2|nr:MAG: 50S ribosomal protein L3 [candidate division CPR2 bacterium GW2011_GWC2_39_35]KKR27151.1 MAG: 50S ribosomal protein L3 [candidate division CPR2 bacterium GW2011_GWD2_39_7]KKR27706.1 MAG: 50S ribosomal protein L3 [candidate division CPR2 bacterium GW2011_GWD1_39_7]KKS08837.1 MAG: 50S ribosomal protein L3 [candidate division CPR2 bacterium GW2011_GWC1_41_48]